MLELLIGADIDLSGNYFVTLENMLLIIGKYGLWQAVLISSPRTSAAADFNCAETGRSCNGC